MLMFKAPVVEVMPTPPFKVIDWLASSVRLAVPPAVLAMLLATVILPPPAPAPAVVTVTSVPALRAPSIDALFTMAVAPEAAQLLLVLVAVLAALLMVMSVGSINHSPLLPALWPCTVPSMVSVLPEVSTKPPSPCALPILITAALPMAVLSAKLMAATSVAFFSKSPPTITRPPPATPLASIVALPNRPMRLPPITTAPPFSPAFWPDTSRVPVTTASPPSAIKTTWPFFMPRVRACIKPSLFTTVFSSVLRPAAVKYTAPPSAWMRPLFCASALSVASSTFTASSEVLSKLSVTLPPAASATAPWVAVMLPSFKAWPPASTI